MAPGPLGCGRAGFCADARRLAPRGGGTDGFTHFELRIELYAARVARIEADGFSHPIAALDAEALPSVMRKCVNLIASFCVGCALIPKSQNG